MSPKKVNRNSVVAYKHFTFYKLIFRIGIDFSNTNVGAVKYVNHFSILCWQAIKGKINLITFMYLVKGGLLRNTTNYQVGSVFVKRLCIRGKCMSS